MKNVVALLLLVLISISNTNAQSLEAQVKGLFLGTSADEIKWIRHFRGRMNDINEVVITLATDGKEYRGMMKYMRSKEFFYLEGRVDENNLALTEKDNRGFVTGVLTGTIEEFYGIEGEWFNYARTVGTDIRLIPYSEEPKYPTYCGDNKWVRSYLGTLNGEQVELILKRGSKHEIAGTAYFKNENKSYTVDGGFEQSSRKITIDIKDENWKLKGNLTGKVDFRSDAITGKFEQDGQSTDINLNVHQTLPVGCVEYAGFMTMMEVTYPKTTNLTFNEAIKTKIDAWIEASKAYTNEYKVKIVNPAASQRGMLRSYFWYDIDYFSETLISGRASFTNTWESQYQGFAFNYDLTTGKEILLTDLFQENSGFQAFIDTYIRMDIQKRPYSGDAMFQEWIKDAKFTHFTIRKDGLHFSTDFHGIFGEQHCIIPYKKLEQFFKVNNPISGFMN